jgi:hypothetical protein
MRDQKSQAASGISLLLTHQPQLVAIERFTDSEGSNLRLVDGVVRLILVRDVELVTTVSRAVVVGRLGTNHAEDLLPNSRSSAASNVHGVVLLRVGGDEDDNLVRTERRAHLRETWS